MTRNNVATTYTDKSGKFAKGNPGRPKGSRHKHVLAIQDLLDGEAETLGRKAIDLALAGDTTALRLCIERIAPARKDSPVAFDLPTMTNAQQAAAAAQGVLQAVSQGDMTPHGHGAGGTLSSLARAVRIRRSPIGARTRHTRTYR